MFKQISQVMLFCLVFANSWAAEERNTRLFLMVQEQGEPLFKPVDLSIFRLEKLANKKLIYKSVRHTAALNLPAGQYMAQVYYQNRLVRQPFELVSHEESFVSVELNLNESTTLSSR